MDALALTIMLFQSAAVIAMLLLFATSTTAELRRRTQPRAWGSTGDVPSDLELLEGPHAEVKRAPQVEVGMPADDVRYG